MASVESNKVASDSAAAPYKAAGAAGLDQLGDEEIVKRVLIGNTEAFDTLVLRYQDRVYNLLVRMSGSEAAAEDLAQETFLKAYRALASFRQGSAFYTWLFRIAANSAFTRRRTEGRRKAHEGVSLDGGGDEGSGGDGEKDGGLKSKLADRDQPDPSANLERETIRQRIQEGLAELDANDRDVIVLRDIEGLDYDAIAEVLKITRAAVKSRLHRARMELAKKLKDLRPE